MPNEVQQVVQFDEAIQPTVQFDTEELKKPPKRYLPGHEFGKKVAKGMGLDPESIAAAEEAGGQWAGAKEIGSQVLSGLWDFTGRVIRDPFRAIDPFHSMASNLERGISERSPGQILGATANILGGAESAARVPKAVGTARNITGTALRTPEGGLRSGTRLGSQVAGAVVGHETLPYLGGYLGYKTGPALADWLVPKRPSPVRATPFEAEAPSAMSPITPAAIEPSVLRLPEPRRLFSGEQPNYMASVPREELGPLALSAKPGAGTQLQQLGKPVLYTPPEGFPGPRGGEVATFGGRSPFAPQAITPSPSPVPSQALSPSPVQGMPPYQPMPPEALAELSRIVGRQVEPAEAYAVLKGLYEQGMIEDMLKGGGGQAERAIQARRGRK